MSALNESRGRSTAQVSPHYTVRGSDYVARRQAELDHPGFKINASYFKPFIRSTDHVLDFGCGNGGMLPFLQKWAADVEALEVNPVAAQLARNRGFVVHGSMDSLGTEARYDVIVSNHVLEHVRDVPSTLEELKSVLKPGGRLVVKLPIDDIRSSHQRRWSRDDVDRHLQTWTPRLFANVLFDAGFEVLECRIITSAWHPKLFPLEKLGLARLAYWAFAILMARRQLFAVAVKP